MYSRIDDDDLGALNKNFSCFVFESLLFFTNNIRIKFLHFRYLIYDYNYDFKFWILKIV